MSDDKSKVVSIDGGPHKPGMTIIEELHNILDTMPAQYPEILQATQAIVIIMDPAAPTFWRLQKGCKLCEITNILEIVKLQYLQDGDWI